MENHLPNLLHMDFAINYPFQPNPVRDYATYNWGVVNTMAEHGEDAGIFVFEHAVPEEAVPVCKVRTRNMSVTDIDVSIMPHRKLTMKALFEEQNPVRNTYCFQDFLRPNLVVDKYFQLKNSVFYELFDNQWYTEWNKHRPVNNLCFEEFDACVLEGLNSISNLELQYATSVNLVHSVIENFFIMTSPTMICLQKELHSFILHPSEVTTLSVFIIGTQLCVLHTPEIDEDPMTKEIHLFGSGPADFQTELFVQRNTITNSGCAIFLENNTLFVCAFFAGDYYTKIDMNSLKQIANPEVKNEDGGLMRLMLEENMDSLQEEFSYDQNQETPIVEEDGDGNEDGGNDVDMNSTTSSEFSQDHQRVLVLSPVPENPYDDFMPASVPTPENQNLEFVPIASGSSDSQNFQPADTTSNVEAANQSSYIQNLIDEQKEEEEHALLEQWTLDGDLDADSGAVTSSNSSNHLEEVQEDVSDLNLPQWVNDVQIPVISSADGTPTTSYESFMANLTRQEIIQLIVQSVSLPDLDNSSPNASFDSDTLETFDHLNRNNSTYEIVVKEEPMSDESS